MLLLTTVLVIVPDDLNVKAEAGSGGDNGEIAFNFTFIQNLSEKLSNVIFEAYEGNDLRKGRFFGSDGEHFAALNILKPKMIEMGLYNPCSGSEPYLEKIENIHSEPFLRGSFTNLTEDLQPNSYGITIYDIDNDTNITLTDFHIEPTWNWRMLYGAAKSIAGYLDDKLPWEVEPEDIIAIFENWAIDDYGINMAMNESWLTKNVSYSNLSLVPRPTNFSWFWEFLDKEMENISNNESITDYSSLMAYIIPKFQDHYDFKFGELTPDNASDIFSWYYDVNWTPPPPIGEEEDFIYIVEDNSHNPNVSREPTYFKEFFEKIDNWWKEYFPKLDRWTICGDFTDAVLAVTVAFEMLLWNRTMPNCKGVIQFNHEDNKYDMQNMVGAALNSLYINGSMGKLINASKDNYKVSFWIDQSWMDDVESYNVIGQINGKDQSKTVILSGLYDCWYNQGTVDGAIGMSIVLAIAKYFKENDITPKYTIRFVGYAAEEANFGGAYNYEALHLDEDIIWVIDLNQFGFSQPDVNTTLNIATNDLPVQLVLPHIIDNTDYSGRVEDNVDIEFMHAPIGSKSNVDIFSQARLIRSLNIFNKSAPSYYWDNRNELRGIMFLRDENWYRHHRDGINHTTGKHEFGDSMNYYSEENVEVISELILNVTKFACINPYCYFNVTPVYTFWDSDDANNDNDIINVTFTVNTTLPIDQVAVRLVVYPQRQLGHPLFPVLYRLRKEKEYIVKADNYFCFHFSYSPHIKR